MFGEIKMFNENTRQENAGHENAYRFYCDIFIRLT